MPSPTYLRPSVRARGNALQFVMSVLLGTAHEAQCPGLAKIKPMREYTKRIHAATGGSKKDDGPVTTMSGATLLDSKIYDGL